MSEAVRETMCTQCEHREVCKHRGHYLKMLEKVQTELSYFTTDFIKTPVEPVCKYYKKNYPEPKYPIYRGADVSTKNVD